MPGQNAFPRDERLVRRRDYETLYREGRKSVGRAFVLYVVRRDGQGRKAGFTVSRRVGKAVVRNRVKRYMKEVYRTHRFALPGDMWLVLVARPAANALSMHECRNAIRKLLKAGDVLCE